MQLNIVSVEQKKRFKVQWVELETAVGNFIIQPDHAPMILELQPKTKIRYCLGSGKQATSGTVTGIAHITRDAVTILIDNNL